jgi:hypothetical protein
MVLRVELACVYSPSGLQRLFRVLKEVLSEIACLPGIVLPCSPRMTVNHLYVEGCSVDRGEGWTGR